MIAIRPPRYTVLLLAALLAAALAYLPSLKGGYVFDDYPNIVVNPAVHLTSLDLESLREATLSSPSSVLVRPLAMLSFGIDWYVGGGDPAEMKIVNLAIHLLNGLLLFALIRLVVRRVRAGGTAQRDSGVPWLALAVTAAWLLAPINFTAVGYVVQRMESLCQVFVLAGLLGYAGARERMLATGRGFALAILALVLGTGLGVLSKESAVLLPLYAFALEYCVYHFARRDGRRDRRLVAAYVVILLIPACVAATWALRQALSPGAWAHRPFTLGERLLTEPRVLFDYVRWSLLPTSNSLALYHDSIAVSKGLLDPPTTFAALLGLLLALAAIPLLRKSHPLVSLSIAWFLGAHLLTGTVIPLELAFEHRNYFASIGLYLAALSLLVPRQGAAAMPVARTVGCAALLVLFASVTFLRARDWSNPVEFALSEAQKNPNSPRTAYELGRTYVVLSHYKADSPLVPLARETLEHAATMPGADGLPDQALLMLAARMHEPTSPAVWKRLQDKLAAQPLSVQNLSAVRALSDCAISDECAFPAREMVATFLAALQQSQDVRVLPAYANYAVNVLHDSTLALDLARESFQREPNDLQVRRNLILLLQTSGKHDEAVALYEQTLRDLPASRRDRGFAKFSEETLHRSPATMPPSGT